MESSCELDPQDAMAQMAAAQAARERLTGRLRLPSGLHAWLGAAVAVQVATAAYGIAAQTGAGMVVLLAGCVVFAAVAGAQVTRFRRLNGATVNGWVSRAVLGTASPASVAYAAGLTAATWSAWSERPLLVGVAAAATGAAYATAAQWWWQVYRGDPSGRAHGESPWVLVAWTVVAVGGLVALVASR